MEDKRTFNDCFLFFFEEGIFQEDEVERCERCVGEVTNGCRILVEEVERSCVEFGLVSFGSKGITSLADEVTRLEQCHFLGHKLHMLWPGIEPCLCAERLETDYL
jgi:hypothetical protein